MSLEGDLLRDFHTDLSVGDILRRERVRRGLPLEDVELATKISKTHLIAIEEMRLELLPGRIYTIGFIRSYGEHLGLDGEKLIQLLKRQSGKSIAPSPVPLPAAVVSEDASLPRLKTFFILFVCFVLAASVGPSFIKGHDVAVSGDRDSVPPVPANLKQQMTLLSKPTASQKSVPTSDGEKETARSETDMTQAAVPSTSQPVNTIVLKAVANVWLEIRDNAQQTVFSRVLSAGEEYWVPDTPEGLVMTVGNAGGLVVSVGGQDLPFFGKTGKVIRNIPLHPEKLKERLKKAPKKAM